MPESLLSFLLARLDRISSPVFLDGEIAGFPPEDLEALVADGLLRETEPATEIPRPARVPGGGRVVVRRTAQGLFGVADEDEPYFDPIPLTEDDVRQYVVSLPRLVERVRRENGIEGNGCSNHNGLVAIGQKSVDGWGTADVFLSLPNEDDAAVRSTCLRLKGTTVSRLVVLVTPTGVALSPEGRRVVDSTGVILASLSDSARKGILALNWSVVVGSPDVGRARTYPKETRVFQCQGSSWLVVYDGTSATVDDLLGMRYIQHLLGHPGKTFTATELHTAVSHSTAIRIVESTDDVERLSAEDLVAYRGQITALDRKIAAARGRGDDAAVVKMQEQRSLLVEEVRRSRGRPASESPERKKPRQSVSKAVDRALKKIRERHAGLGRHLDATLKLGSTIVYQESPNSRWTT